MGRPTYVLGTGLSHDGSACLLRDGEVLVAIEKERITRAKHDGWNDSAAISYCLSAAGIDWSNVSLVVQNGNFTMFRYGTQWFHGDRNIPPSVPVVSISHHLAHAYSALFASPFEEASVLVIDGCGNAYDDCVDRVETTPERPAPELSHLYFEKDSFYVYESGRFCAVYKDFSPWGMGRKEYPMHPIGTQHSIGGVYLAVSTYVFNGFEDAGKLMGLAPYGRQGVYEFPIFDLTDGRVMVRYDWMQHFREPSRSYSDFKRRFQYFADIARWVQGELERAIVYVIQSRRSLHKSDNLCYSGGVALNAVANSKVLKESGYRNVFIQPAAGDNGLALGCAYYGWIEVLKRERRIPSEGNYFGMKYDEQAYAAAAEARRSSVRIEKSGNIAADTAELLANGKVVGWFQGGSEFGPRALGNRSILADPRRASLRDHINANIKRREDFRPFAPSVLAEDASIYFECEYRSPHMLLVAPVREEWRSKIPSVVHCDGSARIQTVTRDFNPLYYDLLVAFKERTGLGILLNTSLNRRGMPIVETPAQAVEFLITSALDYLVMGEHVIEKTGIPAVEANGKHPILERLFQVEVPERLKSSALAGQSPNGCVRINVLDRHSWVVDLVSHEVSSAGSDSGPYPLATVDIDADDWISLFNAPHGSLDEMMAGGRIKVVGDSSVAMQLAKLLGVP